MPSFFYFVSQSPRTSLFVLTRVYLVFVSPDALWLTRTQVLANGGGLGEGEIRKVFYHDVFLRSSSSSFF